MDQRTVDNLAKEAKAAGNFRRVAVKSADLLELCKAWYGQNTLRSEYLQDLKAKAEAK
jgi:hypothetical protein